MTTGRERGLELASPPDDRDVVLAPKFKMEDIWRILKIKRDLPVS